MQLSNLIEIDSLIIKICGYLNDHNKLNYLSTSKSYDKIKNFVSFNSDAKLCDIVNLAYFDQFTRICLVIYSNDLLLLPKTAKFRKITDDGFASLPKNTTTIITYIKDYELREIYNALSRNIYYTKFQSSVTKIILKSCGGDKVDYKNSKLVFGDNVKIEYGQTLNNEMRWIPEFQMWGYELK